MPDLIQPTVSNPLVILQDQKPAGTTGGTSIANVWQTRVLNTKVTDTNGICTLASNQFTLLKGTYRIQASAPCYIGTQNKIRLYNITDSATTIVGSAEFVNNTASAQTSSFLFGRFTIAAQKTFEIQHFILTAASGGLGVASSGDTEIDVFTSVIITKEQ